VTWERWRPAGEMRRDDFLKHAARRVILIRHRIADKERPGGKRLLGCPGYLFQALVTHLPESVRPIEVWRDYNGRAGREEVIKQLDADFALPKLCLKKFWSTEAALSLAVREEGERAWWRRLLEKIQCPLPNCNSVPARAG